MRAPLRYFLALVTGISLTTAFTGCRGAEDAEVLAGDPQALSTTPPPGVDFSNLGPCDAEREPNNDRRDANQLVPARCGAVTSADTVDYLTFRLKASSTSLSLKYAGEIRLRVEVQGASAVVITDENDGATLPFVKDADYIIGITSKYPTAPLTGWRVEFIEN